MPEADVVFIGAGGHARVLLDSLRESGDNRTVVVLDGPLAGGTLLDAAIVGGDELIETLARDGATHFVIAVGGIGNNVPRERLFERALRAGLQPLSIVHPAAHVSRWARVEPGAQILVGAVVNAGALVGANAIVNTASVVEHDCSIGEHAHVATGARLASTVMVGRLAHVGAGATVRQSITIGERAIVGAGAVVIHDVPANAVVVGVPAKERST